MKRSSFPQIASGFALLFVFVFTPQAQAVLPSPPESIAAVDETREFPEGERLIFLIQDAHTNESGQINESKTLKWLFENHPELHYIFLEAGQGDESLSFLREEVPLEERQRVGMSFLRKAKLQGPEYFNLTEDFDATLWGVEDMELYREAWESYRAVAENRTHYDQYFANIDATVNTLKAVVMNAQLVEFFDRTRDYADEKIPMTDYLDYLIKTAGKDAEDPAYAHLAAMKVLRDDESRIDFEKVNREFASVKTEDGAPSSAQKLKSDAQEQLAFFMQIEPSLNENHTELKKYIAYLRKYRELDPKQVLKEQDALETRVFDRLAVTKDEKLFVQVARNLSVLEKFISLKATPEDFQKFTDDPEHFDIAFLTGFLNKQIMDRKKYYERAIFLDEGYEDFIGDVSRFYELTYQRDEAFVANMTAKMDMENQSKAVLVTGGFHTPNLKKLLEEKGISYSSIIPLVTHETDHERYERLLLAQDPEASF